MQAGEAVGELGDAFEGIDFVVGEVDFGNVGEEGVVCLDEVEFVPAGVGNDVFGEVDFAEVGEGVEMGGDGANEVVVGEVDFCDTVVIANDAGIVRVAAELGGGDVP